MTALQKLTAAFATLCMVALIALSLRDASAATPIITFAVLFALSLVVTVFDPSRLSELSLNFLKGELVLKTATQEQVDETLKADAEMERDERKDGEGTDKQPSPLAEEAKHKSFSQRTDADYLTLATDAWRAKNYADALRFAYAGLERPASDKRITATLNSRLGTIESALGLTEQAEQHYRHALEIDPGFAGGYNNLGIFLEQTKKVKEAEAVYRDAIRLDPGLAMAHSNLGLLLSATDRLKEAEAAYRESLRLDPLDPVSHNNLGALLANMGRFKEAEAAYREAIRLDPDYAMAQRNLERLLKHMKASKEEPAS